MMPPPPGYFAPPPRQQSWARTIFFTLASSIFGLSIALNIYLLIAVGLTGAHDAAQSSVVIDGDPTQKVAVVAIENIIDTQASKQFDKLMREIDDDANVKALVVEVDTPGGDVTASDEIYQRLMKFKTARNVKVVVSMGRMATSGGYYIACAADHVVAQPTTLTGNVGVVLQRFNFSELMDKWGVKDTSVTPADSKFKYSETPFRPETPETTAYLKGIADDVFARFKSIVATARAGRLKEPMEVVADGRAHLGDAALKMGLIDQIGYASDAYAKAASLAGLTRQHVVRYERSPGLLEVLGGAGLSSGVASRQSGGVSVQVDSNLVNELSTPRLMFLYRGE
jgi:protease-4